MFNFSPHFFLSLLITDYFAAFRNSRTSALLSVPDNANVGGLCNASTTCKIKISDESNFAICTACFSALSPAEVPV
jgi:hypothetical protein